MLQRPCAALLHPHSNLTFFQRLHAGTYIMNGNVPLSPYPLYKSHVEILEHISGYGAQYNACFCVVRYSIIS